MKGARLRLVFAGLLALAVLAPLFIGGDRRATGLPGSSRSRRADGRAAALFLSRELGWRARPYERPPGRLDEGAVLWLSALPFHEGEVAGRYREEQLGPAHSPQAYLRFVEQGGTLVLPVVEGSRELVVEHLGFRFLASLMDDAPAGESRAMDLRGPWAETLRVGWGSARPFAELELDARHEVLIEDPSGQPLALRCSRGSGALVLLADDRFLDNASLSNEQNALLFVRLLESLAPGRTLLFDEYALGSWNPQSPLGLAFGERFLAVSMQALLLLTVFLWRHAWVSEFPREQHQIEAVSPLARARALVSLYERAGRRAWLAELAQGAPRVPTGQDHG